MSTDGEIIEVPDVEALVAIVGVPGERAANKERDRLSEIDRAWLATTPFCMIASADAQGRTDASPKGDPPGQLVHVIDDRTIAIAERPGNRRVDGYRNVLENPYVGINFMIPGRGDTLRVNGRARVVSDAPFFDEMVVRGQRPILALLIEIDTLFFHCAKAIHRAGLWDTETWDPQGRVPRRAVIADRMEPIEGQSLADLDEYYDRRNYDRGLY